MVLGSLSFLVLALMVVLSFNLSHALRGKIGLQQHSDTLAYSMAVMEARALNYYAVTNRAVAASYVAMNSVHAYMSAASVTGQMMNAARKNFYIIAAEEFAQCGCLTCVMHCVHGLQALRIASRYSKESRNYDNRVRRLEPNFNEAIRGLDLMVDRLHDSQKAVHVMTLQAVTDGQSHGLSTMADYSAPGVSALAGAVGALNANEFNCAVDGLACTGSVGNSSREARSRVMTEVANASRPGWAATRAYSGIGAPAAPPYMHPQFVADLMRNIPGSGIHTIYPHQGTAKTVQSSSNVRGPGQVSGNNGLTIAAAERGTLFNQWRHGVGLPMQYSASIWSDRNGGGHQPGGAHSGQHEFEGVNAKALTTCILSGNCFMKFRANPDANRDFGQPRVYSYLTRQLRGGDPGKTPWELNRSGQVRFEHDAQGSGTLTLAPGEAVGLSKGLVYYHRFGENGWREAPNLFNPYWRAKLHPFTPQEAASVLGASGNSDAAQLAATPGVSL